MKKSSQIHVPLKFAAPFLAALVTSSLFVGSTDAGAAKIRGRSGKNAYPNVIDKTVSAAEKCAPKTDAAGTKFCTGFKVTNKEVDALVKGGRPACEEKITQAGYTLTSDNKAGKIPKSDWDAFISSTQTALTFHDTQQVAMKPASTFVDCMHEWIHVLQWTRANDKLLSPRVRERTFKSVETNVTEQVDRIQDLEKSGLKAHALIQAGKAQQAIDHLKEYGDLTDTLDEIEAHVFVLRNCDRMKCSSEDRETALANLYKRRDSLSPALRAEVEGKAKGLVNEKKKEAIVAARAVWKSVAETEVDKIIGDKLKLDWQPLIRFLNRSGLRMVAIDTVGSTAELGEKIPADVLVTLPAPTQADLDLIRDSKVLSGGALAKFVCVPDKGFKPAIFVTPNSTKGSLVHEYVHMLQSEKNQEYCANVFSQREVDAAFNGGKLDRKTHDQKLLFAQALNVLAEKEVYSLLLKHRDLLGKPESMNNELMLTSVQEWLNVD
jgi:hypothetical protein